MSWVVLAHSDLFFEALEDSSFGVIEGHYDMGINGSNLWFGLEYSMEGDSFHCDDNCDFI